MSDAGNAEKISWYRLVALRDEARFAAAGWTCDADLPPHLAVRSVLMRWVGAGDPPDATPIAQRRRRAFVITAS
jgi:hypothetical protein